MLTYLWAVEKLAVLVAAYGLGLLLGKVLQL